MKRIIKTLLVFSVFMSLLACSPKSKLLGTWTNGYGTTMEFKNDGTVLVTVSILGFTDTTILQYKADEYTITLTGDGQSGLVVNYALNENELTIKGTFLFDGTYLRTNKKSNSSSPWTGDTGNNSSQTPDPNPNQSGQSSSSDVYLSRIDVDEIAENGMREFVRNYEAKLSQKIVAYLPNYLECEKLSDHQYTYTFVFFGGDRGSKEVNAKGVQITIVTQPNRKYSIETGDPYDGWILLENVNDREMNIRNYPDTSGERMGSVDVRETVRVYRVNFEAYKNGSPYIWYSINQNGTRWVADGIGADKDYYKFGNGCSTKDMVFQW